METVIRIVTPITARITIHMCSFSLPIFCSGSSYGFYSVKATLYTTVWHYVLVFEFQKTSEWKAAGIVPGNGENVCSGTSLQILPHIKMRFISYTVLPASECIPSAVVRLHTSFLKYEILSQNLSAQHTQNWVFVLAKRGVVLWVWLLRDSGTEIIICVAYAWKGLQKQRK